MTILERSMSICHMIYQYLVKKYLLFAFISWSGHFLNETSLKNCIVRT